MIRFLHNRQHLNLSEGSLAAPLVVERTNTNQTVRTLLDREGAVHVLAMDDESSGLNTGLFSVGRVVNLDLMPVLVGPAQVHAHEHLGPVSGIHATGTGADVDDRLALVVRPRKHRSDLEGFDVGTQLSAFGIGHLDGVGVALLFREFVHHGEIVEAPAQRVDLFLLRLRLRQCTGDLLRVVGVVPQRRVGGLGFQLPDPVGKLVDIDHLLNGGQRRVEFFEVSIQIRVHGYYLSYTACFGAQ